MALDLRLSLVRKGVAAMTQDCNYYQLDTTKLGRKKQLLNRNVKHIGLNRMATLKDPPTKAQY
jgi:hypothetical protein